MEADRSGYSILNDPRAGTRPQITLALPGQMPVEEAAEVLEHLLRTEPDVSVIALHVGGEAAAVTSRDRILSLLTTQRDPGAGDGATLPGESSRYRLLRLRCTTCGAEEIHLHVDPDTPPACPNGHGALAFAR